MLTTESGGGDPSVLGAGGGGSALAVPFVVLLLLDAVFALRPERGDLTGGGDDVSWEQVRDLWPSPPAKQGRRGVADEGQGKGGSRRRNGIRADGGASEARGVPRACGVGNGRCARTAGGAALQLVLARGGRGIFALGSPLAAAHWQIRQILTIEAIEAVKHVDDAALFEGVWGAALGREGTCGKR